MTSESRLDAMVEALRQVEPGLDDLTRTRVAGELGQALRPAPVVASRHRARWIGGFGFALAAAAVIVVIVRTRAAAPARSPAPVTAAPVAARAAEAAADGPAVALAPAAPALPALAAGGRLAVAAGASARLTIGSAEVTVYGPGHIAAATADDGRTTIDADAVLVDRARGDGVWPLRYAELEVRVTHATFALDRTLAARVTVMRGELELACPSGTRTVGAGQTATCGDATATTSARTAASDRALAPGPAATVEPPPAALPAPDPYQAADQAMRRGDRPAARAALEQLLADRPASTDAAAALLDLARLAAAAGEPAAAVAHLDTLAAHPHGALLAGPAARVLARLAVGHAATDCAAAAPWLATYLDRHAAGADAAAVRAWRDRCAASD